MHASNFGLCAKYLSFRFPPTCYSNVEAVVYTKGDR